MKIPSVHRCREGISASRKKPSYFFAAIAACAAARRAIGTRNGLHET